MKSSGGIDQPVPGSTVEDPAPREQDQAWDRLAVLSHKINNPLTSLLGRAQLLRQRANVDPYVVRAAEVIEECSKRIADHLREISALVKQQRADGDRLVTRHHDDRR